MAVIGKIRKHSGLLIIVIGVALAAFVLGDVSKTQTRGQNYVGEVNGDKISYQDFTLEVDKNIQYQKEQQQKTNLSHIESFYVKEQTWNQMVNYRLLGEEFENLGLNVSKEELAELLHGANAHYLVRQNFSDPATGMFNPERVKEILRTLGQMPLEQRKRYYNFEQNLKLEQVNTKYNNLIRKAYYVPESIAQQMAKFNLVTAKVELLAKETSAISDDAIEITEKELKDYYNLHLEDYKLEEERRSIDYVVFEVLPSANDRIETTKEVNEIYQDFLGTDDIITFVNTQSDRRYDSTFFKLADLPVELAEAFENASVGSFVEPYLDNDVYYMAKLMDKQFRPDSMLASHVLISYVGSRDQYATRTKDQAKSLADSLYRIINRDPSKLAQLALEFSNDPSVSRNMGDMGWFADGTMVPEFNTAVLKANVGEVVMAETTFGYHIIEVGGKKNIRQKYRIAVIERAVEASGQTFQDYWTRASKFAAENTTYDEFIAAIPEFGLTKRTVESMDRMNSQIHDIESPRQIVRWAFDEKSEVGSLSPIMDLNGKYFIAIVSEIEPEGHIAFEKVKDEIETVVRKEKKLAMIEDEIKGLNNFDQISEKWNTSVEKLDVSFNLAGLSAHGREPQVAGNIFGLSNGEVKTVVGERGVYVVKLLEIKDSEVDVDIDRFKGQIAQSFTNKIYQNAVIRALTGVADIEEERHLFY